MDVRPEESWATHLRDKVYEIISRASCPVLTVRTSGAGRALFRSGAFRDSERQPIRTE